MTTLVTCSYRGGVQSTAIRTLAAQLKLAIATFLFSSTGDDPEYLRSLHYVRAVVAPYVNAHGIAVPALQDTQQSSAGRQHQTNRAGGDR
jgi:hypothetical protein